MREWRLTMAVGLVIIFISLLLSVGIFLGFSILIWPHIPEAVQVILGPFGFILLAIINVVANLTAIPASVVQIRQMFYDADQRRRVIHRQSFALERLRELQHLGLQEDWKDEHFAELEAEVMAEGRRRIFRGIPFLSRLNSGLRLEKSLSSALATSQERLILVEGEPGSGKSVALRHVAETLAARAAKMRSAESIVPIYVNLKELERPEGVPVDRNLIEEFILESLLKKNDRDIEQFLDEEFSRGIREGTWLFLFDSFDELPEVLSSTEADVTIKSYGNAIDDFLSGLNRCRGIVASRQFRGPAYLGWPRFRVLPLSERRRFELIYKIGLKPQIERKLIQEIATSNEEIRSRVGNPLFLTLLCKHMKSGYPFPSSAHTVFETYISSRFDRDKDRLQKRFGLDSEQLRLIAEKIAFCMNADKRLGLSPTRENLRDAMIRLNLNFDGEFDRLLDALEYMKLARADILEGTVRSKTFTFAHRRFQEYFATCVVLREPSLFSPKELLTNERWRETAVTMCQTQPINVVKMIVREAGKLLKRYCTGIPDLIDNPAEYIRDREQNKLAFAQAFVPSFFPWPSGSLHLLNLLQDGFSSRLSVLPHDIRVSVSKLVLSATEQGTLSDRKWALEVAGIVPEDLLAFLLKKAFASKSQWLKEVAYRQASHLSYISPDISRGIRYALISLSCTGRLHRERYATEAHLARIKSSDNFLAIMRLLLWLFYIDITVHVVLSIVIVSAFWEIGLFYPLVILLLFGLLSASYFSLRAFIGPLQAFFWAPEVVFLSRLLLISFSPLFLLLLIKLGIYNTRDAILFIIITFITIYLIFFGPFAFFAAKTGKFVKFRWWPLIPAWPILYVFTDTTLSLSTLLIVLTSGGIMALWMFLNSIKFPSENSSAASSSSEPYSPPDWLVTVGNVLGIIAVVVAFIGLVGGVGVIGWWVYSWAEDWLQWYSWRRERQWCQRRLKSEPEASVSRPSAGQDLTHPRNTTTIHDAGEAGLPTGSRPFIR